MLSLTHGLVQRRVTALKYILSPDEHGNGTVGIYNIISRPHINGKMHLCIPSSNEREDLNVTLTICHYGGDDVIGNMASTCYLLHVALQHWAITRLNHERGASNHSNLHSSLVLASHDLDVSRRGPPRWRHESGR